MLVLIFKPVGSWKLNTDGAFKESTLKAGCGGVLRSSNGNWVMGYTKDLGSCDALMAEIWAITLGLQLLIQRKLDNIIVESDSQMAITYLSEGVGAGSNYSSLVKCQHLIRSFHRIEVRYCSRSINLVADKLANLAFIYPKGLHVFEVPPDECLALTRPCTM